MSRRIGLWLIGAHGGVSTTVAIGLAALKKNLTDRCGLVSELPQFSGLGLIGWDEIVLGGHEIRKTSSIEQANSLCRVSRAIDPAMVAAVQDDLAQFDTNVKPGIVYNVGQTIESLADKDFVSSNLTARDAVNQIQADLNDFVKSEKLDSVIVLNLASTEPPLASSSLPNDWEGLNSLLDSSDCPLPASSLYAIASIQSGFPFVNFTPSLGNCLPAIDELAKSMGVPHMGHDGKTGETLLKSVLAPAFANRHLDIMSWVGHNIFGNMDGQVLDDPINKKTKVDSKDKLLGQILGYDPQTHISIEYIKSLGDWKTAWDHIHFKGFLGTPMILTFTWQGCDSILAAPLVLDLMRFTELAQRRGESGIQTFMSSFFKSPLGTDENDFAKQFAMLTDWCGQK